MTSLPSAPRPENSRARQRGYRPQPVWETLMVLVGALIVALSFNLLLKPNGITPGGLPGVSMLVLRWFHVEPAVTQAVFNVLVLAAAAHFLGWKAARQSVLGCVTLPILVWLTRDLPPLAADPFLAAVCGAGGTGIGVGLVFRGHGSLGGFTTIALIVTRKLGRSVGTTLWLLDGTVVLIAAFLFPPAAVLASAVGVVLIGRTAQAVLTGFDTATLAFIVSNEPERIRQTVLHDLDLGMTLLPGRGGFTDQPRDVLLVVMRPGDVPRLKAAVKLIDPSAFLVLARSHEVLGHGFKPHV